MGQDPSEALTDRRAQLDLFIGYFDDELKQSTLLEDTTVELVLKGELGGHWLVVAQNGAGRVHSMDTFQGTFPEVACKLETDMKTVSKLANGEMKPAMAFLRRKVKYSGSYQVLKNLQLPLRRAGDRAISEIGPERLGEHIAATLNMVQKDDWTQHISFILSSNDPGWKSDSSSPRCNICLTRFGFLFRKHHCRVCGHVVCSNCSPHQIKGNRVCTVCFQEHIGKSGKDISNGNIAQKKGTQESQRSPQQAVSRLLPYERLLAHISSVQNTRIGAMFDAKAMSMLDSTRKLLMRLRFLEAKVANQDEAHTVQRLASFMGSLIPYIIVWGLLVFAWKTVILCLNDLSLADSSSGKSLLSLGILISFSNHWKGNIVAVAIFILFSLNINPVVGLYSDGVGLTLRSLVSTIKQILLSLAGPEKWLSLVVKVCLRRPFLSLVLLPLSALFTIASRLFGRLLYIYSTAAVIIASYYSVNLVCKRMLKMSDQRAKPFFEALDDLMAPFACNRILALKSVFVKFGQYIGSRADIIPPKWSAVLAKLQDDMPSDTPEYVERCIEEEFGYKIEDIFESFDLTPMASASVAQVHRGVVRSGVCPKGDRTTTDIERYGLDDNFINAEMEVAIKVQHEGIEEIMTADTIAFARIVKFIAWLNPRFAIAETLLNAWKKEMLKELDFSIEAENLWNVRHNMRNAGLLNDDDLDYLSTSYQGSQVIVPKPIHAFVSKRAFCMTYVHGFKITDLEQLDLFAVDRSALVKRVIQAYSNQLYVDGLFNADPHAGNLMVSISDDGTARPVLLDFGMVVTVPEEQRLGYCKLVQALSELSVSGVSEAMSQVGYKNSQSELHPERDLEFFSFLLRDTGDRKSQRESASRFRRRRKKQRKGDLADDPNAEGRFFANFPDSLIFLFRVLGLIRGLCTTLDAPISYMDIMGDYAKVGLLKHNLKASSADAQSINPAVPKSPRRMSLNSRVGDLIKNAAKVPWEPSTEEGFAVEDFLGCQVFCMQNNQVVVDAYGGVLDELVLDIVSEKTLFPLMDLTRVIPVLILLNLVDNKVVSLSDPIALHWAEFKDKRLTIQQLLSYSSQIEDLINPSIAASRFKNESELHALFETTQPPFVIGAGSTSKYTMLTFGYIISGLLRGVMKQSLSETFETFLKKSIGQEDLCLCADGLLSQGDGSRTVATVRNGFARALRGIVMGGGPGAASLFNSSSGVDLKSQPNPSKKEGKAATDAIEPSLLNASQGQPWTEAKSDYETPEPAPSVKPESVATTKAVGGPLDTMDITLPSGVLLDPCSVNSRAVRDCIVPSFSGFGTASAFTRFVENMVFSLSEETLSRLCTTVLTKETNQLFGTWNWGYGFQVYKLEPSGVHALVHHAFGGSLLVIVPSKKIVLTVLVNCLTLDRTFTREVVSLVLKELGLSSGGTELFGGMF